MKTIRKILALSLASLLALGPPVYADESEIDIGSKFRAKIVKEKAKQATLAANEKNGKTNPDSSCGSQNIGNVDTGGRIGSAPREVFVFAPNSINLVTARGCN